MAMSAATKIVVLGESGVGKSSFVAAACKKPNVQHESTVGAAVSVTLHEYRAGTSEQREEIIELWDVGGNAAHRPASTVFLDGAAGVILVHDLTNRKSEANLGLWLALLNGDRRPQTADSTQSLMADLEATQVPILLVGTRLDQAPHRGNATPLLGASRLNLDCRKEMPAGSTQAMQLSRFFDAAVDRNRGHSSDPTRRRKIVM